MITRDLHGNLKCFNFLGRFEESMNQKNRDNDISRKTTEKIANMYQPDFEAKLLICSYKYIFYIFVPARFLYIKPDNLY